MFAADLAEMLSVDMQKEGLSGRTLTLKLKTTTFEVRTRAVTLQKYICSSEDILKYASKLLKAELPVSLRLIGTSTTQYGLNFLLYENSSIFIKFSMEKGPC
ncbi:dna polymerase kappa [Quercus suber]|uniref:DNA-directed DNA polymerase n=1 Tax=Quercus suber TaxID=58331 RepID=A0AAW0KDS5_QUESU